MPRNALIYDHMDLILATESVAPVLGYLVQGAVVPSIVETSNVRRPGPRHERAPHRFDPGHRLRDPIRAARRVGCSADPVDQGDQAR